MAGFRGKNLRSGDLAEQLGILLLQNVALVSPVPRTEDLGLDVVATLIRDFDGTKYIAEDSFFVQIKSASINEITFKAAQVKWLAALQLPLFIASVDRKSSTLHLYTTHYLSDVLAMNSNRDEITLEMNECSDYECPHANKSIRVPTGPRIISWSLETLTTDKNFINEFYQLLKSHVTIAKKSIETRRVGISELVVWEIGREPIVGGMTIHSKRGVKEVDEVIQPYLSAFLQNLIFGDDLLTIRSLFRLLDDVLEYRGQFAEIDGKKTLKYKANSSTD